VGAQFLHVRSQLDVVTLVRLLVVGPFVEQFALPVQVRHLSQQALIFDVHRFGHKSPETQNPLVRQPVYPTPGLFLRRGAGDSCASVRLA
jgi:hypothetical protein